MAMHWRDIVSEDRQRGRKNYSLNRKGAELISNVIKQKDQTDKLVDIAETLGRFLAEGYNEAITTSQIRNVFGEVRKTEMEWKRDSEASWVRLQLLRPKLAYTAKKDNKARAIIFRDVLSTAILNVEGKTENFQRFVNLFEAILAYHRASGGR